MAGGGGGLMKVSSVNVSGEALVDLPCCTQPPNKGYWTAPTERHVIKAPGTSCPDCTRFEDA